MGHVYLARATGLGGFERQVVVKTLDLSITDDDESFITMFLDEARLVGALNHQYIAPVYEVGCDEEGHYYLVMDYVHGETAEAVFRACADRSWPVPLAFSLTVVSCVASALDYAHNLCAADGTPLDIVHRDISLSNVMIGHDGAVKLIDFGIAKAANRATKTQVGTLKGKIGYLAPEQILRKQVDHRADIFALGIVLYELTTRTRAFRESSDLVTLERITNGEIRRPSDLVPQYPPELERIVMKALEVDPANRYQDAATMGREIEALAARIRLPLGHAPIAELMTKLFGEQRNRRRRRLARSSDEVEVTTDVHAVKDEPDQTMPIELSDGEVEPSSEERRTKPLTAVRPGSESGAAQKSRAGRATIPLTPRPRPVSPAPPVSRPAKGTPESIVVTPVPTLGVKKEPPRLVTGPHQVITNPLGIPIAAGPLQTPIPGLLPIPIGPAQARELAAAGEHVDTRTETVPILMAIPQAIADAPTQINAVRGQREDPTEQSPPPRHADHHLFSHMMPVSPLPAVANLGTPNRPAVRIFPQEMMATAVVARPKRKPRSVALTGLMILSLVFVAITVALLIALL